MTADTSQLRRFSADLRAMPSYLRPEARKVIEKGALTIKERLRREMQASRSFKGAARSISYDMIDRVGYTEAEIGPVRGHPGSLANIAYFGTSKGGGTVADPDLALEAEAPNVEKYLADMMARYLR